MGETKGRVTIPTDVDVVPETLEQMPFVIAMELIIRKD